MFLTNSVLDISPNLKDALTDIETLAEIHGHPKIIADLVHLAAWEAINFPHQKHPLAAYCPEERDFMEEVFESLKLEIQQKIAATTEEKAMYKLPEIELTYKYPTKKSERHRVIHSRDAYQLFLQNWSDKIELVEEFNILFTDNSNSVLGMFNAGKGGGTQVTIDARVIFAAALKVNAKGLILSHNHPAGNPNPSQQDLKTTEKLQSLGKELNIPVLDHIIITREDYFSFADEGLLNSATAE